MCGQHLIHKVFLRTTKVFWSKVLPLVTKVSLITKGFLGFLSFLSPRSFLLLTSLRSHIVCFYRSTMNLLFHAAGLVCYSGAFLSLVIATKLLRMENLTFFNSMFLVYFSLDFIFGNIETYFHFKLWMDRSSKLKPT